MIKPSYSNSNVVRIAGAFTAAFSLAMGILVLYVIPGACSFVGSIQLVILGLLFIAGVFAFLLGSLWMR